MDTLDVEAEEWFDELNGNSYFSAKVTVDYGKESEAIFSLPFQYGYGDQYMEAAREELIKRGYIDADQLHVGFWGLWSYCRDNGVVLRASKHDKAS